MVACKCKTHSQTEKANQKHIDINSEKKGSILTAHPTLAADWTEHIT